MRFRTEASSATADLHPAQQALEAERRRRGAVCRVAPQAAPIERGIMRGLLAIIHLKRKAVHLLAGIASITESPG